MKNDVLYFRGYKFCTNHKEEIVERRLTIAGKIVNGKIKIAAAECGNADNFQKSIGRKIAEGRIKSNVLVDTIEIVDENKPTDSFINWCKGYCNARSNARPSVKQPV